MAHGRQWGLCFGFLAFAALSWILLFRDSRALGGIMGLYPQLATSLVSAQQFLLHHGLNSIVTALFAFVAVITFGLYYLSLREHHGIKQTIILAVVFQIIVLFSYPVLSTDIFSYAMTARVATVYHQNIWLVPPINFSHDPFFTFSDWRTSTNIYGGTSEILYLLGSQLAANNLLVNIVIYKLIVLTFSLLSIVIVYKLLETQGEAGRTFGLRFIFWNPLYILEIAGSGHNDSILFFLILLAFYLYQKQRWILSGIVFALGVQVKIIPIFLLFFLSLQLLRQRNLVVLTKLLIPFVIMFEAILTMMRIDLRFYIVRVLLNSNVYWQSLPALLSRFHFSPQFLFTGIFALLIIGAGIWQLKRNGDPLTSFIVTLGLYLLFLTSAYWNWYVLWVFVMIPLVKLPKLRVFGILFTLTSLLAYPLYWLSLRFDYQNIIWATVIYSLVCLVPGIYLILPNFRRLEAWLEPFSPN